MAGHVAERDPESIEIDLLLEGLSQQYGYDFRDYARASLKRRIRTYVDRVGFASVPELMDKALRDPSCFQDLLLALTVNVTSMFRDSGFWVAIRQRVLPLLRTYPFFRVWCAGCATGEEVYSLAIVLEEECVYDRCRIYATDINESVLNIAQQGIFPLNRVKDYSKNYHDAGGKRKMPDYYTPAYGSAMMSDSLKRNLVFAQHNLVTDASFNEFHMILCRNVTIYFDKVLRDRVHGLIYDSLARWGVLGLGRSESLRATPHAKDYEDLDSREKIFRRIA